MVPDDEAASEAAPHVEVRPGAAAAARPSVLLVLEQPDLLQSILRLSAEAPNALLVTKRVSRDSPAVVALVVRTLIWNDRILKGTTVLAGHTRAVTKCEFSADGNRIVTRGNDGTARLLDAETGAPLTTLGGDVAYVVKNFALSPDGKRLVTASNDGTARLWDAETGALQTTLEGHDDAIVSCVFSPDGKRVATRCHSGTELLLWDAETGALQTRLEVDTSEVSSHCVAFSWDGKRVVTSSEDDSDRESALAACIFDAETGALQTTLEGHDNFVYSCPFSPDDKRVLTVASDCTARLWDAETGALQVTIGGYPDVICSGSFSPDGTRVLTASSDKAFIWDVETGTLLTTLEGHAGEVWSCAFSPDGKRVVTAGLDKTARLWDAETGALQATLEGHTKSRGARSRPTASAS